MPNTIRPLRLPGRMSPTDAMFWYAESAVPVFRPLIAGLYVLEGRPDADHIATASKAVVSRVPRLRQRVVDVPLHLGLPEWVDDAHFDLAYHLRRVSVPEPGGNRELFDLTAAVLATPLDRERPLWEAYWIDGLARGRSAYFLKMHHCLVDGVGALAILNALTQTRPDASIPRVARARPAHGDARASRSNGVAAQLTRLAVHNVRESSRLAWRAAAAPARFVAAPRESLREIGRTVRGLRGVISDLSLPTVADPLVRSTSGLSRRLDVMDVPVERLRKIKEPLGVTINDVVLAALAGTLGRYHCQRRARVDTLNCMVPMNLRSERHKDALGNYVGNIMIVLPVGERSPERRLQRIVEQTRAAKRDQRGATYPFLVQTLTMIPGAAFRWLARQSLGRVNVACTNIPGVPEERYMAGARVHAIYPFASVVEGTPIVMALLSYADTMNIGIDTDPEAIPDPHRIVELFAEGLDEMEALAARVRRPG